MTDRGDRGALRKDWQGRYRHQKAGEPERRGAVAPRK